MTADTICHSQPLERSKQHVPQVSTFDPVSTSFKSKFLKPIMQQQFCGVRNMSCQTWWRWNMTLISACRIQEDQAFKFELNYIGRPRSIWAIRSPASKHHTGAGGKHITEASSERQLIYCLFCHPDKLS